MTLPATSLLCVRDLVVQYAARGRRAGITAVRGVSLDIAPASIRAVVGESGCGKTSLARAILRLLPVSSGRILLDGQDLTALNPRRLRAARREIQAVFQDPMASLSPRRTVLQTLREPLDHFRIGAAGDRGDRAVAALEQVGLDAALRQDREQQAARREVREIRQRLAGLVPGEVAVMDGLMAGKPNKKIAAELGIGLRTVELRRARLLKKMHAGSLAELVRMVTVSGYQPQAADQAVRDLALALRNHLADPVMVALSQLSRWPVPLLAALASERELLASARAFGAASAGGADVVGSSDLLHRLELLEARRTDGDRMVARRPRGARVGRHGHRRIAGECVVRPAGECESERRDRGE